MKLREDYLTERMQDEEFRAAYEEWGPDFEIANALLEFRATMKLTQAELAKIIKINRSDLSKLESADANPTLKTLKKIAIALGAKLELRYEPHIKEEPMNSEGTQIIQFSNYVNAYNEKKCEATNYSIELEPQQNFNLPLDYEHIISPATA